MATSGRPVPREIREEIFRLLQLKVSRRKVARHCGVSATTVQKLAKERLQVRACVTDKPGTVDVSCSATQQPAGGTMYYTARFMRVV